MNYVQLETWIHDICSYWCDQDTTYSQTYLSIQSINVHQMNKQLSLNIELELSTSPVD